MRVSSNWSATAFERLTMPPSVIRFASWTPRSKWTRRRARGWRRYNSDGYGQREDGGPFTGAGKGRGWPLLTGERGHYEVAAGRDASQYVRWLEALATPTHLLPEQVWDEDDRPEQHLKRGRPTGSAVPLLWAHAEYIKLLRSVREGRVFDLIPEVADRYIRNRSVLQNVQIWVYSATDWIPFSAGAPCASTQRTHSRFISRLTTGRLPQTLNRHRPI